MQIYRVFFTLQRIRRSSMKMQRKRKTQVISLTSCYRIPVCQG